MGRFFALLTLLAATLLTASVNAADLAYVVIEKQARPLQIEEYSHNHSGVVTDVVKEIFNDSGHRVAIHTVPFKTMIADLEAGRYSNWITFGSPSWSGVQALNLTDRPLLTVTHSLLTTAENPFRFTDIQDLYGKTAVLLEGFDYPGLEQHIKPGGIRVVRVKNYALAFKMLDRLGTRGFLVEMKLRILYNLKQEELTALDYKLQDFSSVIPPYNVHLAMSPSMPEDVQQLVNERLEQLHKSGELTKMVDRYR